MEIPMIDWLSVTVDIKDYELRLRQVLEGLEKLKKMAVDFRSKYSQEKVYFEIGDQTFEVLASGTAGYAYILHNSIMELRLAKFRSGNKESFPLYVHFKSEFLWSKGPEMVWSWFAEWVHSNIGRILCNKLNRVDICCHTDTYFEIDDLEKFRGKHKEDNIHRANKRFTGFVFGTRGSSTVYMRIYDKSREVKVKRDKLWFFEIWNSMNMDLNKVWNVEFELHRDILKQMKIEACEELFDRLKPVWSYLTREWIIMTDSRSKRRDRCKPTERWARIQRAFDEYRGDGYITREKQKEVQVLPLIAVTMGCLSSYSALEGYASPEEGMTALVNEGMRNWLTRGKSFKQTVAKKRKVWGLEQI